MKNINDLIKNKDTKEYKYDSIRNEVEEIVNENVDGFPKQNKHRKLKISLISSVCALAFLGVIFLIGNIIYVSSINLSINRLNSITQEDARMKNIMKIDYRISHSLINNSNIIRFEELDLQKQYTFNNLRSYLEWGSELDEGYDYKTISYFSKDGTLDYLFFERSIYSDNLYEKEKLDNFYSSNREKCSTNWFFRKEYAKFLDLPYLELKDCDIDLYSLYKIELDKDCEDFCTLHNGMSSIIIDIKIYGSGYVLINYENDGLKKQYISLIPMNYKEFINNVGKINGKDEFVLGEEIKLNDISLIGYFDIFSSTIFSYDIPRDYERFKNLSFTTDIKKANEFKNKDSKYRMMYWTFYSFYCKDGKSLVLVIDKNTHEYILITDLVTYVGVGTYKVGE